MKRLDTDLDILSDLSSCDHIQIVIKMWQIWLDLRQGSDYRYFCANSACFVAFGLFWIVHNSDYARFATPGGCMAEAGRGLVLSAAKISKIPHGQKRPKSSHRSVKTPHFLIHSQTFIVKKFRKMKKRMFSKRMENMQTPHLC